MTKSGSAKLWPPSAVTAHPSKQSRCLKGMKRKEQLCKKSYPKLVCSSLVCFVFLLSERVSTQCFEQILDKKPLLLHILYKERSRGIIQPRKPPLNYHKTKLLLKATAKSTFIIKIEFFSFRISFVVFFLLYLVCFERMYVSVSVWIEHLLTAGCVRMVREKNHPTRTPLGVWLGRCGGRKKGRNSTITNLLSVYMCVSVCV